MRKQIIEVPVAELSMTFDVRKVICDDHITQLSVLYEQGVDLPPLEITASHEIVDGRHRKLAMELAGIKNAKCQILEESDRGKLIMYAFKANIGGALPPTHLDIIFAITRMLESGMAYRTILNSLPFPKSVSHRYLSDAQSGIRKKTLAKARHAIIENGMTVRGAAMKYDIEVTDLKQALSLKKKNKNTIRLGDIKAGITHGYRSLSMKNYKLIEKLILAVEDGEVQPKNVELIIDHIEQLITRQTKNMTDWRIRVRNLSDSGDMGVKSRAG